MTEKYHIGQRLSFDGALCTVRYIGQVEGQKGDWLGVEWDDPIRGKHSGQHKGKQYFECLSRQPTAGSFVRPTRPSEPPRGFLEALHQKYASEFEEALRKQQQNERNDGDGPLHAPIVFNGKVAEEVGFDKIRRRLAELEELRIVLLDGLRVGGVFGNDDVQSEEQREAELEKIRQTAPKIAELDLSRNLLERWRDVRDICAQFENLRSLKLNGNRFEAVQPGLVFERIAELHLDQTFMSWDQIAALTHQFPSLSRLNASFNQISSITTAPTATIRSLTLEYNEITSLSSIRVLSELSNLEHLSLRGNNITVANIDDDDLQFSPTVKFLDVSHNSIDSWSFVNALPLLFPGLESLRISNNPLFDQPVGPSRVTNLPERPMTVDEAFMLTLARLKNVRVLNYSKISPQDRSNGELYYLSLIGKELSASAPADEPAILAAHPRYTELCETYGEPTIKRAGDGSLGPQVSPHSVAARLVKFHFHVAGTSSGKDFAAGKAAQSCDIPRTFDGYRVRAIVSRLFSLPLFRFRLIWETDEWDPVEEVHVGGEEWDSDAEHDDGDQAANSGSDGRVVVNADGTRFIKREVELMDSVRPVGFWFDDALREARVRVEMIDGS